MATNQNLKIKVLALIGCLSMYASAVSAVDNGLFDNGAYYGPTFETTTYSGAYYTGDYTSPFKTYLGKTDAEIQAKLDALWNHYFKGDNNSKVYYETNDGAYIKDISNNDVRSEGMAWGMMICVQTNHKEEFDKLWKWTKAHMWHSGDGYFSWSVNTNGTVNDSGCCPDAEMYFIMSLMFAAHRWNDEGYMKDAQAILKACWKGNGNSLFNEQSYIITFQPTNSNNTWSDPAYSLPTFVDLFYRWSDTNTDKWASAVSATRDHLYKSSNSKSGLFSDYNNFDGTPHAVSFNSNASRYMTDAIRCAMNFGMDYYLFGADAKRQAEMAKRIIDFFETDGYKHGNFNWDGTDPKEPYTVGQMGCNAVAALALKNVAGYEDIIKKNLKMAWDASPMTGEYRYYNGIVHYLAMLHLCGSFKIWKPAPSTIALNETDGVTSIQSGKVHTFTRSFSQDVASTVCLPFNFKPMGGTYYMFHSVDKSTSPWTVTMKEADPDNRAEVNASGQLTANTPYLFKPAATGDVTFVGYISYNASNFTAGSVVKDATNADGSVDGAHEWQFKGTYVLRTWATDPGNVYAFSASKITATDGVSTINAGDFFRISGGDNSKLRPFRACLEYVAKTTNARGVRASGTDSEVLPDKMIVRLIGLDGSTTAVGHLDTKTGDVNIDQWYGLDGRKFDGRPTKSGLYINNGKKIVVK